MTCKTGGFEKSNVTAVSGWRGRVAGAPVCSGLRCCDI